MNKIQDTLARNFGELPGRAITKQTSNSNFQIRNAFSNKDKNHTRGLRFGFWYLFARPGYLAKCRARVSCFLFFGYSILQDIDA